ncbi:MAG TPA: DUF4276 family protein [Thermoanaerobaculia bacterium]|nr:DUF4276 family protein [Thermoanaerobaculia bacterium]
MHVQLACIVEGDGEIEAVPLLVRRIAQEVAPNLAVHIVHRIRLSRGKLNKPVELERAVELAARRAGAGGAILIVFDSDGSDPEELEREVLARAVRVRSDFAIGVALAHMEFEAWFLAAAESLRGCRGLTADLTAPADPEAIRGAKEWLSAHMEKGRTYAPVLDQPALAATFDLSVARQRSPSFERFYREVTRLLAIRSGRE